MPRIDEKTRWNLGGYLGSSKLKAKWLTQPPRNIAIGLNAGVIYELNAHGEIELGLRYETASFDINVVNSAGAKLSKIELEINHIGAFIGYNYKF